jgi:hypothetical protein
VRTRPERLLRATARGAVALATASFVALVSLALALAPTAPVEALAVDGQSWIAGEIPQESGDPGSSGGASSSPGDHDPGDDAVGVQASAARQAAERRAGSAQARRRGIRLAVGADPRGPPAD